MSLRYCNSGNLENLGRIKFEEPEQPRSLSLCRNMFKGQLLSYILKFPLSSQRMGGKERKTRQRQRNAFLEGVKGGFKGH